MNGLVTFRLGTREYATALSAVREVVRLDGLADLPGMTAPLAGVLDLRGSALPVMDLRTGVREERGDVLVLEGEVGDGLVGIAVDKVRAVVAEDTLPPASGIPVDEGVLPAYVLNVLRGPGGPVFLVDLPLMLQSAAAAVPVLV
ncbi:MAG: CheW protein [Frankiales bacterium]|nr:CheW protein [Frankiales bacterium]